MKRILLLASALTAATPILHAVPLKGVAVYLSDLNRAAAWGQFAGANPGLIGDYTTAATWSQLEGSISGAGLAYTMSRHKPTGGDPANPLGSSAYVLELSVPMFPDQDTDGTYFYTISDRLSRGAAGNYNSHWTAVAQALVARGMGDIHIRLGYEFNLPEGSSLWSVGGATTAKKQYYATYWQQIRTAMMAVSGANFKWDWSALTGQDSSSEFTSLTTYAYPGNSYVDYISCDAYDSSSYAGYWKYNWQAAAGSWSNQPSDVTIQDYTWSELSTGNLADPMTGTVMLTRAGLDTYKAFADSKTKPFLISECGITDQDHAVPSGVINFGNNDDPAYIRRINNWATANSIYGIIYFEFALNRQFGAYGESPNIIDHALLPGYWQSTAGANGNPLYPQSKPHPRAAAQMKKELGSTTPASQLIPSARKYAGTLEIPSMSNDWLFQNTTGAGPVYLSSFPTIVKASVTGTANNWKGISFLGLSSEVGYCFEAYCGSSNLPDASPSSGPVFRLKKNGTQIWSSNRKPVIGTLSYSGANWTTTAEEMSVVVTNDPTGGKRIKMMFGPDVVGEITDSYGLSGRVDGAIYQGQSLNGVRQTTGDVQTTWVYEETYDDGAADGFTLSGWATEQTQLHAPNSASVKTATRGAYTDTNYTVACQVALNTPGKAAGVSVLTDSSGNGYRVELKSKDETTGVQSKDVLDTIRLVRTGSSSTALLTFTATDKLYMGQLQDLKIVTKDISDLYAKVRVKVYLNDKVVLDYTDVSPTSRAGKSGLWAEASGSAWVDNYVQITSIFDQVPMKGLSVNPGALQRAVNWGTWANYTPQIIGDGGFATTWAQLGASVSGAGMDYVIRKHKPNTGDPANPMGSTPYILELALPMFPEQDLSGTSYSSMSLSTRLSSTTGGAFDSYWTSLATALVNKGMGDTILRLGWEFNQPYSEPDHENGTPTWAISGSSTATQQAFATYWRRIHDLMMAVPGAHFRWSWSVLVGEGSLADSNSLMTYAYPGDAYVDLMSCDVYDGSGFFGYDKVNWQLQSGTWASQPSDTNVQDRLWEGALTGNFRWADGSLSDTKAGLEDFKMFADSHGKDFIISECGIVEQDRALPTVVLDPPLGSPHIYPTDGLNDDPAFLDSLFKWAVLNEIYGVVYFEFSLQRNALSYEAQPTVIDHALLPDNWVSTAGTDNNPFNPMSHPHPRTAATLLKHLGSPTAWSTLIPSARKYLGSLEIPSMNNDWLFQSTTGSSPVYLAATPTIVKASVTGAYSNWKGISMLGLSSTSDVGYCFEAYCGTSGVPSASPSNGPIWRVRKGTTQIWSSSRPLQLGTLSEFGANWTSTAEEMCMIVTNDPNGKRIKLMFGPDVIGEFSDSYGLTGRTDGSTYNGQTLNGVRQSTGDVQTAWFYMENFDDGQADGFTLSGWNPYVTQMRSDDTSGAKTAMRGATTDSAYTVACQMAGDTTGKAYGVKVLTSSSDLGYRVELVSKNETAAPYMQNVLDTIKVKRIGSGGTVTTLATYTATNKYFMGELHDLKVVTSTPAAGKVQIKVSFDGTQVIDTTDNSPSSTAGKSGVWSEGGFRAFLDNYIQLPTI